MSRDAELVTGPDGRQVLRLPREMLDTLAGTRLAALESEIANIRSREAQPDRIARTGAAFEAWARSQMETQQEALRASVDAAAVVGERIASALEALVQALAAKDVTVNVSPAPVAVNVEPAKLDAKLNVVAKVELPPPRERKIAISVDKDGNAEGVVR